MRILLDSKNQPFVEWQEQDAEGYWKGRYKRAGIIHNPEYGSAGDFARYLCVGPAHGRGMAPVPGAEFPIFGDDLDDETLLEDFV